MPRLGGACNSLIHRHDKPRARPHSGFHATVPWHLPTFTHWAGRALPHQEGGCTFHWCVSQAHSVKRMSVKVAVNDEASGLQA